MLSGSPIALGESCCGNAFVAERRQFPFGGHSAKVPTDQLMSSQCWLVAVWKLISNPAMIAQQTGNSMP
jgi:hypothetical protein